MKEENIFCKYTVVDFTRGESGAVCSEYLSMSGMNVIRVIDPASSEEDNRIRFVVNNLNKTCVRLDVTKPEGRELFYMLIDKADVLVENLPHGEMDALGFGYETLRTRNPRLIYASIKPYAKGSPWENYPANRSVINAMGCATYLCGYTGGDPVEPGVDLPDIISSAYMATGICAALYQREATGEGQSIEVSQQASLIALARSAFEFYDKNRCNNRAGNRFPTMPDMVPMDMLFPAKGENQWVIIGCTDDKMFARLCEAIGKPELINDPRFSKENRKSRTKMELYREVEEWTSKHDKYEIMELLALKNRIICAAVRSIDDIVNSEESRRMGPIKKVNDPVAGEMWIPAMPCSSSGIDVEITPPITGEDAKTRVFGNLLGLSRERIVELSRKQVI
mgnify:FL=1